MTDIAKLGIQVDSRGVSRATGDLNALSSGAERAEGRTAQLATSFARLGRIAGPAAAALAAGFSIGSITSSLAGFDESISRVGAVSRATAGELADMRKQALLLGSTTEFSASDAAAGLNFLAMAGFSASEGIAAIGPALDLATAASLDLSRSADIASNIMSAFSINAGRASEVADVLASASARANTDVSQLGEAMKFVGPVASALEISINDTAAAIGVLSDAGIQGGSAGTGLRRVLSSLANPTKEASDVINRLGLDLRNLNPATTSITSLVSQLAEAGLDAADALTVFGDRGGPAILALTSQVDSLRSLTGELSNVEGEAKRMADTMRDNLMGDLRGVSSAAEGLALAIGDAGLTQALRNGAQGLADFLRSTTMIVQQVGGAIDAYRRFTNAQYALESQIQSTTDAMSTEVSLIGEVSTGLELSNISSATSARNKLLEASAIRDKLAAMVQERAALAQETEEYKRNAEAIREVTFNMSQIKNTNTDGGSFAPMQAKDQTALEKYRSILSDLVQKRQEILGLAGQEASAVDAITDRIEETSAAIEAAASGQEEFNGRTIEGSTFAERLSSIMGNVAVVTSDGAAAASGLASALGGANAQAAALIANLGMVPAAMASLGNEVVSMSESLSRQNAALTMQLKDGTDARVAGLKAERDAILNKMEIEGLDMVAQSDRIATLDRGIAKAEELANKNNSLTASIQEKARAEAAALSAAAFGGGGGGGGGGSAISAAGDAQSDLNALMREGESLTKALRSESEKYADALAQADRLLDVGAISLDTYNRHVRDLSEEFREAEFRKFNDGIKSISDAFADAVVNGGDFWDSIGDGARKAVADLISSGLQQAIQATFQPILSGTPGGGSSILGNLIGSIFTSPGAKAGSNAASATSSALNKAITSFDGGGYTGDGPRSGGMDGKGGFLAMVHPGETIHDGKKGGAGVTVKVTNNVVNESGSRVEQRQNSTGGMDIRIFDRMVSDSIGRGAQSKALSSVYGVRPIPQGS